VGDHAWEDTPAQQRQSACDTAFVLLPEALWMLDEAACQDVYNEPG
jgi:hypothetical protein